MRRTLRHIAIAIGAILLAISGGIIGTYITLLLNLQPNSTTYVLKTETNTTTRTNELHIATKENLFLDTPKTVYVENNLVVGGTLSIAKGLSEPLTMRSGGTGTTFFTAGGIAYGTESGLTTSTAGQPNQILTVNPAGLPSFVTLSGDLTMSGSTLTVNVGSITATKIANGAISDEHISPTANIDDTKLSIISTTGKVTNSATTATSENTPNTIVSRDPLGNFSAGSITGSLIGAASANVLKTGDSMTGTLSINPPNTATGLSIGLTSGNALEVNTDKFSVAGDTGNTAIAGNLSVASNVSASGSLTVSSLTAGNVLFSTTNGLVSSSNLLQFNGSATGIGGNPLGDTRLLVTGYGDTSSTYSMRINNGVGTAVMRIRDDRYIETFGTSLATNTDGVNYAATIRHVGGTVGRNVLLINSSGTSATTTVLKVETGSITDAFVIRGDGMTGLGTAAATNVRLVVRGSGTTSLTTAFRVEDSAGSTLFTVRNDGALTVTGSLTITSGLTVSGGTTVIAGPTRFTPSATQTVTTSGNTLTANATTIRVAGSAGNVTLSGVATITAGSDGQILYIVGSSDTNTVTLTAGATETLVLGSATRVLGKDDVLQLMYNSTSARWIEISYSNNTTN
jgi:hypothetical protein